MEAAEAELSGGADSHYKSTQGARGGEEEENKTITDK
ncbi:uncharacterized protein G2W53_042607 [Senna tora]|uniref:Uncharacterized protein n=1 Tax=Senna tora TaxID=362788 RepID=A0A834W2J9_9FABA|nr:uncharacterized protein G2W53_042607 [Senna tora]